MKASLNTIKAILFLFVCTFTSTLFAQNPLNVRVTGLLPGDSALVIVQIEEEYQFEQWVYGDNDPAIASFNLSDGRWAVLLDATGYNYPQARVFDMPGGSELSIAVEPFEADGFSFQWRDDESFAGHARQVFINEPSQIRVLNQVVEVPNDFSSISLRMRHGIVLANEIDSWSREDAYRLYKTLSELPTVNIYGEGNAVDLESGQNVEAIFTITSEEVIDDVQVEMRDGIKYVTVSKAAFTYAEPMTVLLDGIKGRFFSKRLSKAMINYLTDYGRNYWAAERLAQEMFGLRFMGSTQETEDLMGEDASNFQDFHAWEKVEILAMLQELPTGMHKQEGLRYLVRRVNGQDNPTYPSAAAIAWTGMNTIEFMSKAFNGGMIEHVRRLILHEKAHFLWAYTFDEQLKADWIELGGWVQDPSVPSGWVTTNTTEFVSAYGHDNDPNEDMAETVAWYVTNPEGLRSRSVRKFEFVRDRVMHGRRYIAQIREDLTFEVYNLFPDYVYPGKVISSEVNIRGEANEDKEVSFRFVLNSEDPALDGASRGYIRLVSKAGTIKDFWLYPENGSIDSVLVGGGVMNKHFKAGYWHLASFSISDPAGNTRYESVASMGFKFYLNNPEEDVVPPFYLNNLNLSQVESQSDHFDEQGQPYKAVKVSFGYFDNSPLLDRAVSLFFPKRTLRKTLGSA